LADQLVAAKQEERGGQKTCSFLHEGEQHHLLFHFLIFEGQSGIAVHLDREQLEALQAQISIGLA
jgi:hypothetical protein